MESVDPDALRQFARRDWSAAADDKLDYWANQYRRGGSSAARAASAALYAHARRVLPDYPSPADRAADLADHESFRARLDRAARAFSGR